MALPVPHPSLVNPPTDASAAPIPKDRAMRLPAKQRWALVAHYRVTGHLAAADDLLDGIESYGGETSQSLEERARIAYLAGDVDTAVGLLEARTQRSSAATARVAHARLLLQLGRVEEAGEISDDLMATHAELVTIASLAADVARARGDLATARAYHEELLIDRPDHVGTVLTLGGLALDETDPNQAAAFLDHALAANEGMLTAAQLHLAASLAHQLDRATQSAELHRRAEEIETDRAVVLWQDLAGYLSDLPRDPPPSWFTAGQGTSADPHINHRLSPPNAGGGGSDAPSSRPGAGRSALADPGEVRQPITTRPTRPRPTDPEPEIDPLPADQFEVPVEPRVQTALRDLFGHDQLRAGQAAVIANVLARRDTLATMPTGAGKSLTFQLPAMLLDGTTLVISPLIALMKDQVESLPPLVRAKTALVNSTLGPDELRRVIDGIADGAYQLVYAAPERLRQHAFLAALKRAGVALVVIDEAHCISLWGHDFRPDYLTIPKSLPELGEPPVLAITATATPAMARQIGVGLGRELDRVRVSLFRKNLFLEAHRVTNREAKVAKVLEVCRAERGSGIVYVGSRKDAEAIAGLLRDRGVGAIPYHAGLDADVRARNQERFMTGGVRVVVATVAFGMGVDKADVRFIVHLSPPKSLESYAQESGRAGRDGLPARCVLLSSPTDQTNLNRMARRDEIDLDTLRRVYAGIKRAASGRWALVDPSNLLPRSADGDPDDDIDPRVALGVLDQAGLVMRHPDAPISRGLWFSADAELPSLEDPSLWPRFRAWAGLDAAGVRTGTTIRTADACAALDISPIELDRLLSGVPGLTSRDGQRAVCLELLPIEGDARATLTAVLARAAEEARRRIAQVMAYAVGGRCRHARLAEHLGERLPDCATRCDVCRARARDHSPERTGSGATAGRASSSAARGQTTAADALAVLQAVASLPFPMGKTGLGKLLMGSVESRVRADRTPAFGALNDLTRGKIDSLIDRLVSDGFLYRDVNHEFKLISLTEPGADAELADLVAYDPPVRSATPRHRATEDHPDVVTGDIHAELLDRLKAWRSERAAADNVPSYVVAHNSMLDDVAIVRPSNPTELGSIAGFGPTRVEKYGNEILAVIANE